MLPGLSMLSHRPKRFERIRIRWFLVVPPPRHSRKSHRQPRLVPFRNLDSFEMQLENKLRLDDSNRPKSLARVSADEPIDLVNLFVCEARVSFCNRDELPVVPNAKRVIGVQTRASPMAALRVNEYCVDGERSDFPFPPVAARPSYSIARAA